MWCPNVGVRAWLAGISYDDEYEPPEAACAEREFGRTARMVPPGTTPNSTQYADQANRRLRLSNASGCASRAFSWRDFRNEVAGGHWAT
jgi:hypothetical protein